MCPAGGMDVSSPAALLPADQRWGRSPHFRVPGPRGEEIPRGGTLPRSGTWFPSDEASGFIPGQSPFLVQFSEKQRLVVLGKRISSNPHFCVQTPASS